jgi:hypothetical protein
MLPDPAQLRPEDPVSFDAIDAGVEDIGPLFRQYAVTQGRVEPATGWFDLVAYIVTNRNMSTRTMIMQPEHRSILAMANNPISVAEVAAALNLAVGIVRVLLGDLLEHKMISVSQPPPPHAPSTDLVLRKVLHGLRNL